ncbi:hypothetical protein MNO14_10455 [Luteimonas sp. S4-F44]|uniref:hypothetical protein n=1 Tax=Luteimonas sp. S4-F44 TaxID=2925842 RepID=UPI001F53E0D7|nr:hypothetical protein [Luteimonas sp. S4-F44]UNK41398.1 hypothetical protein MNO14_10455 [Luteimonas sp. S4-F44]
MPHRNLDTLFSAWEGELALLLEAKPGIEEFWQHWREREAVIERFVTPELAVFADAAFDRLEALAEAQGYGSRPRGTTPTCAVDAADTPTAPDTHSTR